MRISDWSSDVCSSDLPLLIGEGAAGQAPAYQTLIDAAPALRPRIRAATWIGNRRWNLLFDSGETLALPEEDAARALVKFAELDGADRLLGKGFLRFDMRDPTKLVARTRSEEQTSELQSLMRISYAGLSLTKKNNMKDHT